MVVMDFLHFYFHEKVTSSLKSGWCNKHRNIKENETMTIEIIRSTQITAVLCQVQDTRQHLKVIVSIQERENENIKDANNISPDKKFEGYYWRAYMIIRKT